MQQNRGVQTLAGNTFPSWHWTWHFQLIRNFSSQGSKVPTIARPGAWLWSLATSDQVAGTSALSAYWYLRPGVSYGRHVRERSLTLAPRLGAASRSAETREAEDRRPPPLRLPLGPEAAGPALVPRTAAAGAVTRGPGLPPAARGAARCRPGDAGRGWGRPRAPAASPARPSRGGR